MDRKVGEDDIRSDSNPQPLACLLPLYGSPAYVVLIETSQTLPDGLFSPQTSVHVQISALLSLFLHLVPE